MRDVLTSLPFSVSPECLHAKRMVSLDLMYQELHMHNDLMAQAPKHWPESLSNAVQDAINKQGICSEVVASAVAKWIRRDEAVS